MGLVVNTNVTSLLAQKNLKKNSADLEMSLERLSTGRKINRAADDASGLAISKIFQSQIEGIHRAQENAQDGSNVLRIVESSYSIIIEDLQRIRELVIQASNATNSSSERSAINQEIVSRIEDINNISKTTNFNGVNLIGVSSAALSNGYKFTVGPNSTDVVDVYPALGDASASALSMALVSSVNITIFDNDDFSNFIANVDSAISKITTRRSKLGAMHNYLENVVDNLANTNINVSAAKSRILDTNVANESSEMIRKQIMRNASVSVMSQSNETPKLILGLLKN